MSAFNNATLMITGGTGSFGSTVLKHFLDSDLKEIRIFSRDEKKQDDMRHELQAKHPEAAKKVKFYIGDVRNPQSIKDAMPGVDYIFHAAALKQVPSCEFFPMQAVQTNIIGTDNVLHAAIDAGVKRVVCLSTDKAAYPINAMGISKAMMEHVIFANARVAAERGGTTICCTRYGNVMCSRGSVIPLFIDQIKAGNPITITDPNMTRFLMNLDEAVDLVMFAFQHGNPGDLFIQKSDASTIGDLAKADPKLIELHLKSHGRRLWEFANGMDDSIVESEKAEAKGVGNSTTLSKDVSTKEDAQKVLLSLAQSVGGRLRKHGYHAGVVNVEIKYADFTVNSHQKQLERMTASDQVIYQTAVELFCEMWNGKPIRLLGIRTSKLSQEGEPQQLSLFDLNFHSSDNISEEVKSFENSQKHEKLDQALDEIRKKFGKDAVVRASFLKKPEKEEKM